MDISQGLSVYLGFVSPCIYFSRTWASEVWGSAIPISSGPISTVWWGWWPFHPLLIVGVRSLINLILCCYVRVWRPSPLDVFLCTFAWLPIYSRKSMKTNSDSPGAILQLRLYLYLASVLPCTQTLLTSLLREVLVESINLTSFAAVNPVNMSVMDIKQSNFLRFLSGLHLNMTLMLNPSLISCFPVLKLLPQLVKLLAASGGVFPFSILSLAIFVWKEQFSYTGSRKGKKIKIKEQIIFYFCYSGNLMGRTKTEKKLKISFITYMYFRVYHTTIG